MLQACLTLGVSTPAPSAASLRMAELLEPQSCLPQCPSSCTSSLRSKELTSLGSSRWSSFASSPSSLSAEELTLFSLARITTFLLAVRTIKASWEWQRAISRLKRLPNESSSSPRRQSQWSRLARRTRPLLPSKGTPTFGELTIAVSWVCRLFQGNSERSRA